MHESVRNYFIKFNEPIEGRVPYMYLDIKGLVTVGIGNLIDVEKGTPDKVLVEVKKLPFVYKEGQPGAGTSASVADIEAEWKVVKKKQEWSRDKQYLTRFGELTKLQLNDDAINTLALTKLDAMEKELRHGSAYGDFSKWPADAQLGLLSMAWALGTPKLRAGWPNFRAACKKQDFTAAASECRILTDNNAGVIPRNTRNKLLFNNAAAVLAYDGKNIASNKLMRMTLHYPHRLMKPMAARDRRIAV